MRARAGAPDLARWAGLGDVPAADPDASYSGDVGLAVTWLGVSTVLVTDGTTSVMTDGFFSRPSLVRTGMFPLRPDIGRIEAALRRAGVHRLDAVVPVHTHYDHVLDSATVALRTGADVYGGTSAAHVARGHGMEPDRVHVVESGHPFDVGSFEVTLVRGSHCPPDRYPGEITTPVPRVARVQEYRCGDAWSVLLHHRPTGRRMLVQGSAGYVPGALAGYSAEVAYLGVGQLGRQDDDYVTEYWDETVGRVGARRVVLVHHDNFFRPLSAPLRALPYVVDDLDATLARLVPRAVGDGAHLHLPTLWQRSDPWAGLQD